MGKSLGTHSNVAAHPSTSRHDDFYAWLLDQAGVLRARQPEFIDWAELAEELEEMAASDRREVVKHFRRLVSNFLKWRYSAIRRSEKSWKTSSVGARLDLALMFESKALKSDAFEFLKTGYKQARALAGNEMGLAKSEWQRLFPDECPWTVVQLLDDEFLPSIARTANGRSS
jgi:hypothetical protein